MDKTATRDEERCELTELYISQCAHCRKLGDPPLRKRPGRSWFNAHYPGRCGECDNFIQVGDQIKPYGIDGGYLCRDCGLDYL